jgi:hypothetical protein
VSVSGLGSERVCELVWYVLFIYCFLFYIREGYSNRIFFLTDLEVGDSDAAQFKQSVLQNSNNNLWSTVVGIGIDLTKVT